MAPVGAGELALQARPRGSCAGATGLHDMGLKITGSNDKRLPKRWADFDRHMPGTPLGAFGFKCRLSDVNTWRARYRAAASFKGIQLAGYRDSTVKGYSALMQATLVWAAFERYLHLLGLSQESCSDLLRRHDPHALARAVAAADADNRFFAYVRSKVTNGKLRHQLDLYSNGDPFNVSYLLSGVRHIFGHGHLTPNANETNPETTIKVCDLLSEFHLQVMDDDFSKRVEEFEEMLYEDDFF